MARSVTVNTDTGKVTNTSGLSDTYKKSAFVAQAQANKAPTSQPSQSQSSSTGKPRSVTINTDSGRVTGTSGLSSSYSKQLMEAPKPKPIIAPNAVSPSVTAYGGMAGDIPSNQIVKPTYSISDTLTGNLGEGQDRGQLFYSNYIRDLENRAKINEQNDLSKQFQDLLQQQKADRLDYNQASKLARRSLEPQFEQQIRNYATQFDRGAKARGFYGQAPTDYSKLLGESSIVAAREAAIGQEAERLYNRGLEQEARDVQNFTTLANLQKVQDQEYIDNIKTIGEAGANYLKYVDDVEKNKREEEKAKYDNQKAELDLEIKKLEKEGKTEDIEYKKKQQEKQDLDIALAKLQNPLIIAKEKAAINNIYQNIAEGKQSMNLKNISNTRESEKAARDKMKFNNDIKTLIDDKTIKYLNSQGYGVKDSRGRILKPITSDAYNSAKEIVIDTLDLEKFSQQDYLK